MCPSAVSYVPRGRTRVLVAGPFADVFHPVVGLDLAEEQPPEGFRQRHVDDLSLTASAAADVALEDRHHGRLQGELRGRQIRETDRGQERFAVGEAVRVRPAGDTLRNRPEPRFLGLRARLSVAGESNHDRLLVNVVNVVGAESPPLHRPRTEVLEDDVGVFDQDEGDLATAFGTEIERDTPLVSTQRFPGERFPALGLLGPLADRITGLGMFDHHDIRAEIAHHRRRERTAYHPGHVDDAEPIERTRSFSCCHFDVLHRVDQRQLVHPVLAIYIPCRTSRGGTRRKTRTRKHGSHRFETS